MYTRSYDPEGDGIKIPENYDGNAFREIESVPEERPKESPPVNETVLKAPWDTEAVAEEAISHASGERPVGSFFERMPFGNLFGSLPFFKGGKLNFGTEELIICAMALFLLFSAGGDKECAVMLLLLLWVK